MKNPFYTAGERKALKQEDFLREHDFKVGDIVIQDWIIRDWQRIFTKRLLDTNQVMIVEEVFPVYWSASTLRGWKMRIRYLDNIDDAQRAIPTDGCVNVTPFMKDIHTRLNRNRKFGL